MSTISTVGKAKKKSCLLSLLKLHANILTFYSTA